MIVEDEIIGSHTEDESQDDNDNTDEVLALFGVEKEEKTEEKTDPPIDQKTEETKEEKKGITVKFNKEDTFIEEDKIPEYARKGLNYDKVEGRANDYQQALDRVAKQQGFKDHDELIANLDRIEQEQQEKEQNAYKDMLKDIRQQAEDAGLDPDQVENYLINNPLVKEAQKAIQERDASRAEQETQTKQQTIDSQWQELYAAFPDIVEDSQAFNKGENPTFYTEAMQSMVNQGYKPLDAYKLAHMDKIQAQTKTKTQQRLIKEQQLGLRSQVETNAESDNEPQVPTALASAFVAFGLPAESAKKYMKK